MGLGPGAADSGFLLSTEFPLFSYNNGVVMTSCRELDSNRSALSATSAFAIATAGANEGTPNKEKYRRMSLASAGVRASLLPGPPEVAPRWACSGRGPARISAELPASADHSCSRDTELPTSLFGLLTPSAPGGTGMQPPFLHLLGLCPLRPGPHTWNQPAPSTPSLPTTNRVKP